jgi:hypothetical protein
MNRISIEVGCGPDGGYCATVNEGCNLAKELYFDCAANEFICNHPDGFFSGRIKWPWREGGFIPRPDACKKLEREFEDTLKQKYRGGWKDGYKKGMDGRVTYGRKSR